jgi:hypothetical protein
MTLGRRARAAQYATRVNAASDLLAAGLDVLQAARQLAQRHRVSERQARRYVEQARHGGKVAVPAITRVFTIKLPVNLIRRLRAYAKVSQRTLSSLVSEALEEFLRRMRAGPRGGR